MNGILIKAKPIKGRNGVRSVVKYLDESEKLGVEIEQKPSFSACKSLDGSSVKIHGFIKEFIHGKTAFSQRDRLTGWWTKKTLDNEVKGHHLVFSLSDEFSAKLNTSGIPPSDVLEQSIVRAFTAFERQFHPDERIGFVTGFHDEKDHKHVHCVVFPTTDAGNKINLSQFSPDREEGKTNRIDYLGFLQAKFEIEISVWANAVAGLEVESAPGAILAAVHATYANPNLNEPDELREGLQELLSSPNLTQAISGFPDLIEAEFDVLIKPDSDGHGLGAEDFAESAQTLETRIANASPLLPPKSAAEISYGQLLAIHVSRLLLDFDAALKKSRPAYLPPKNSDELPVTPLERLFSTVELNRELMAQGRRIFPIGVLSERDIGSAPSRKRSLAQHRAGTMLASESTPYDKLVIQRSESGIGIRSPGFSAPGSIRNFEIPNWGDQAATHPTHPQSLDHL